MAFGTGADDLSDGCRIEGMPVVVATHVTPKQSVSAVAEGSRVWLRFGTTRDPRVAVALDVESLEALDAGQAPPETAATHAKGPFELSLAGGARLVAWTDGSLEDGLRVRAVTVDDRGRALGKEMDLGYEGSAIGRPVAAIDPSGSGVLAFVESNGAGFQLVASRLACAAR